MELLELRPAAPAHATGAVAFVPLAAIAEDVTFRLRDEGDVAALAASLGRLGQLVPIELRPLPGAGGGAPRYQVVAGFRRIAALRLLFRERVLARVHSTLDDADAWGLALGQALLTEPLDGDGLRRLRERLQSTGHAPWAEELVDDALVRAPLEPELRERFFEFLSGAAAPAEPAGPLAVDAGGTVAPGEAAAESARGAEAGAEAIVAARSEPEAARDANAEAAVARDAAPDARSGAEAPEAKAPGAGAGGDAIEVTPEELAADVAARMYEVNADLAVAVDAWAELPAEGRRSILAQARWLAALLPHLEDREGDRG